MRICLMTGKNNSLQSLFLSSLLALLSYSSCAMAVKDGAEDTLKTITPQIIGKLSKFLYGAVLNIANTNENLFKK